MISLLYFLNQLRAANCQSLNCKIVTMITMITTDYNDVELRKKMYFTS